MIVKFLNQSIALERTHAARTQLETLQHLAFMHCVQSEADFRETLNGWIDKSQSKLDRALSAEAKATNELHTEVA